jgi:hypothetical protein
MWWLWTYIQYFRLRLRRVLINTHTWPWLIWLIPEIDSSTIFKPNVTERHNLTLLYTLLNPALQASILMTIPASGSPTSQYPHFWEPASGNGIYVIPLSLKSWLRRTLQTRTLERNESNLGRFNALKLSWLYIRQGLLSVDRPNRTTHPYLQKSMSYPHAGHFRVAIYSTIASFPHLDI